MSDHDALRQRNAFKAWTDIQVRIGDLDTMRHVNHAVIVSYFEHARMAVMDRLERLPGRGFVLGDLYVRYLAEIRAGDPVVIGTNVTRIGNKSFTLGQGLFVGDACAATCTGTEVCIDLESRRGAPLPEVYRAVLQDYL